MDNDILTKGNREETIAQYKSIIDEIKKDRNKIQRSIARNNEKIKDYESRKTELSVHGHWSWGYYLGVNSELEKILDEIDCLLENEVINHG